jgi:hypothetical protein
MTSPDPDFAQAFAEFKRGGWLVSLLGLAGAAARWMITDSENTIWRLIRVSVAGSIVGVISFFALYGQDIPEIYKSIIMTTSGAMAPELMFLISRKISKKR